MEKFAKDYFELLTGEYAGINLTRVTSFEEFWEKQILDSIEPLRQSKKFSEVLCGTGLHIDVGFGGGFPLLPLAFNYPEVEFHGFEARAKKAKVVGEIAIKLGLNNVFCHHQRIDQILIDRKCTMSFKAVGKVNDFLSKIFTEEIIQVFFYKGPNFYNLEKTQIEKALNCWKIVEESEINVQGTDKRYIIGFENKKVLRGTNLKIDKKFSNISKKIIKDTHG